MLILFFCLKIGFFEYEINLFIKIFCFFIFVLFIILVVVEGFGNIKIDVWYIKIMKFLVLFLIIVLIFFCVNFDMGKLVYLWFI